VKKTTPSIILVLVCLFFAGCNEKDVFKAELEKIAVPDMSQSILDLSESDQLAWMEGICKFELDTLRSKTSDLTEKNLEVVEIHLSQVFGSEVAQLLLGGFYKYDQDKQKFYVPDGDWFTYSTQWPTSEISIIDRSEKFVTMVLKGTDPYDNNRNIQFDFSISNGNLSLEKRTILD